MTAKQTIQETLTLLRRRKEETIPVPGELLERGVQSIVRMLLTAVLSATTIFGDHAPFGVAAVAASGGGLWGGVSMLGACFGYLSQLELSQGLRYAAAAILSYAVAFAFYDVRWLHRGWWMPMVAAGMTGFTGNVTFSRVVWTSEFTLQFSLEVLLCAIAGWCYQGCLQEEDKGERRRRLGLLCLFATVFMAMGPLEWRRVSVGCILAGLFVLTVACAGGMSAAAVSGLVLGLGMDLTRGTGGVYGMIWGLSGTLSAVCYGGRRWCAAVCFVLFGVFSALCIGEEMVWQVLVETGGAGMLVCLLPRSWLVRLERWLTPELGPQEDLGAAGVVSGKLKAASDAFRALYDALNSAFAPPKNDNDVAMIFDRTAGRVCRGCSLWSICWQKEYGDTFNALNDATAAMLKRGRAENGDFPVFFTSRCIQWKRFLETINEELTASVYRRQYQARVLENRVSVCRQYDQLSELLEQTALEVSEELTPDRMADRQVRERLKQLGLQIKTGVFRDKRGLLHLRAEGPDSEMLERSNRKGELAGILGVPLRLEYKTQDGLSMVQQEPLMVVAGIAAQKKNGETVSGDAGTYFKCPDGMVYMLLCDGMGSGEAARRESDLAIRLLEPFLQAGIPARRALSTLAGALALRGEETGGFTTVDLLGVDLFTGESTLYKLGAAPTYVRQGEQIRRLSGTSLPAGLAEGENRAADEFSLHLAAGDWVVMVSDGICATGEDLWILEELSQFDRGSPKELACKLLERSGGDATDDRTALVIRVEKRK